MNEKQICGSIGKAGRKSEVRTEIEGLQGERQEGGQAEEIWKDVVGYEGTYQVSSYGRVRSIDRVSICSHNGRPNPRKGKILKPGTNIDGYLFVMLRYQSSTVHRIVAKAFLEKEETRDCVDHIDRDKKNNFVSNLRWVTRSENSANMDKSKGKKHNGIYKTGNSWQVFVGKNRKRYFGGTFHSLDEAINKRNSIREKLYPNFLFKGV